jgi:hypothetical protein
METKPDAKLIYLVIRFTQVELKRNYFGYMALDSRLRGNDITFIHH